MKRDQYSEAMKLMAKRKKLLRGARHLDRDVDEEEYQKIRDQAHDLLEQAQALGGLSSHESHVLAHTH